MYVPEKCPSKKIPNEFNRGLNNRSAIYIPFAQAIPNVPVIDRENCIKFKTGKCGACAKNCAAGAIDYDTAGRDRNKEIRSHCCGNRL